MHHCTLRTVGAVAAAAAKINNRRRRRTKARAISLTAPALAPGSNWLRGPFDGRDPPGNFRADFARSRLVSFWAADFRDPGFCGRSRVENWISSEVAELERSKNRNDLGGRINKSKLVWSVRWNSTGFVGVYMARVSTEWAVLLCNWVT